MKLFEYAIIHHPKLTKAEEEVGKEAVSTLLREPAHVLAKDEQQALILAAREIPEAFLSKLSQVEIAIRPF